MEIQLYHLGQTAEQYLPPEKIPHMVSQIGETDNYTIYLPRKGIVHTMEVGEWVIYDEFHRPINVLNAVEFKEKYL
jgi:hypothetical protein